MYSGSGVVECQLWPSLLHLPHSPCCPAPHQCTHGSKEIPHKDTHCLPWMVGTLVGPTCSGPNLVPVSFKFLSLPMQFTVSQYSFFSSSLPYTHSSLTCILPHTLFLPFSLSISRHLFSTLAPLQPLAEHEVGQLSLHHQRAPQWAAVSQSSWLSIQSSDVHCWCSLPRYFTSLTHLSLGSCTIITDKAVMNLFPCKCVVDLTGTSPILIHSYHWLQ